MHENFMRHMSKEKPAQWQQEIARARLAREAKPAEKLNSGLSRYTRVVTTLAGVLRR